MIPDAIFLELSAGFGKPSPAERELLQEQQRALFEGDSDAKPLLELAIEGGFLSPAEAEKFVKLAKLQDVAAPPSPRTSPSERSPTRAPSGRAAVKAPSERGRVKKPSERAPVKAPSERRRVKKPSERAPVKAPSERRRIKKPSERGAVKKPSERAGRASERAERTASGRQAAGASSPLVPALVAVAVLACVGIAFVFMRPKQTTVAHVEDDAPKSYAQQLKDLRRLTNDKLDRGQGERAMSVLEAKIAEWSKVPEAAEAVLELDELRAKLVQKLEEREDPDADEDGDLGFDPNTGQIPVDPDDEPEDEPENEPEDEPEPRVIVVRPRTPPREPPPAKPPTTRDPSDPPDGPETTLRPPGVADDLLGSLDALRERGLTADYLERLGKLKPSDADGRVRLAKWARRNHLYAEERFALKSALRIEPEHRSASRQLDKLVQQELEHRDWHTPWRNEGSQLFVETNTSEAKLYHYSQSVNAFYARYSKIFNVRKTPQQRWGTKIGVRIFATREDFERYQAETGSRLGESAVGYYSLDRKELVLYDDPNDPDETRDTLYHEGTHLFTHLALGEQAHALPPWILEGIAEYFGASAYDPEQDELVVGRPSYMRLRAAKRRVKRKKASLRADLLNADFGNYSSDNYALGWALIHMLLETTKDGAKKPKYQKAFLRCFEAVAKGEKSAVAFERCVGKIPELEREWHAYIADFPVPAYEEGLALAQAREHDAAAPLFEKHLREVPGDARAAFQLGESLYALDHYKPAIAAYREAIRLDHDFLDAYEGLCFALVAADYSENAVEAAQDGFDRNQDARAHYVLAWALHNAKRNPEALEAIREAIALDGTRSSYVALRDEIKAEMKK